MVCLEMEQTIGGFPFPLKQSPAGSEPNEHVGPCNAERIVFNEQDPPYSMSSSFRSRNQRATSRISLVPF